MSVEVLMLSSKRPLQITMAVLALVPIATGVITMTGIFDPLYASLPMPQSAVLDSNLRFFGGVWLGLGLALLWLVPSIEEQTVLFRAVWIAVFLGGVGRLLSMLYLGAPPLPFVGFTALEIVGAPLFIWWQSQVASAATRGQTVSGASP